MCATRKHPQTLLSETVTAVGLRCRLAAEEPCRAGPDVSDSRTRIRQPRRSIARRSPPGFTLIELFVTISVIALLIALLLPAVQQAREGARRLQCRNNLNQMGIALHNYQHAHGLLPPGCVNPTGPVLTGVRGYKIGWVVQILPFMEERSLYQTVDFDQPELSFLTPEERAAAVNMAAGDSPQSEWNDVDDGDLSPAYGMEYFAGETGPYGRMLMRGEPISIRWLQCPSFSAPGPAGRLTGISNYAGCHASRETPIDADNDGLLYLNSSESLQEVPDGITNTILLGEHNAFPRGDGWFFGDRSTLRNGDAQSIKAVPGQFFDAIQSDMAESSGMAADPELTGEERLDALRRKQQLQVGGFGSSHLQINFLLADGSVKPISPLVSANVLRRLCGRNDGELISAHDF